MVGVAGGICQGLERQLGWERHPAWGEGAKVENRADSTFAPASRNLCHSGVPSSPRVGRARSGHWHWWGSWSGLR